VLGRKIIILEIRSDVWRETASGAKTDRAQLRRRFIAQIGDLHRRALLCRLPEPFGKSGPGYLLLTGPWQCGGASKWRKPTRWRRSASSFLGGRPR